MAPFILNLIKVPNVEQKKSKFSNFLYAGYKLSLAWILTATTRKKNEFFTKFCLFKRLQMEFTCSLSHELLKCHCKQSSHRQSKSQEVSRARHARRKAAPLAHAQFALIGKEQPFFFHVRTSQPAQSAQPKSKNTTTAAQSAELPLIAV